MTNVTFVAACFPEQILNELIEKKDIDDIAANVFGQRICNCLSNSFSSVDVVNEHKNIRFPHQMRMIVPETEITLKNVRYHSYGYLNIVYLERWFKSIHIKKWLDILEPSVIVVYSLHTPYLQPVIDYKRKSNCKVIVVVPDLPEYMSDRKNWFWRYLKRRDINKLYKLSENADGFIILTKYMAEKLPISNKKVLVLEGIAEDFSFCESDIEPKSNYILYSGSVSRMYGLPEFINSYIKSEIQEDLYICGAGSYVEELKKITKKNPKIKYLGILQRKHLKEIQRKACLLINPRNGNDEYTKYSFPSKTMEYLASGTPVMMEHLRGIPDEYYNYIIEVKNGDWITSLKNFSNGDKSIFNDLAKEAVYFIKNKKTVSAQSNRIKSFIESL